MIPIIRAKKQAKVHLIAYAAPVTKNMLQFSQLLYYVLPRLPVSYTIPDWLLIEVGIFAGQLYIDFPQYTSLSRYLQLAHKSDAGVLHDGNQEHVGICTTNVFSFLLDWLTIRRKGQDIMDTPIGYICQGRLLHESHPFFVRNHDDTKCGILYSVEGRTDHGDHVDKAEDGDTDLEDKWDQIDQLV